MLILKIYDEIYSCKIVIEVFYIQAIFVFLYRNIWGDNLLLGYCKIYVCCENSSFVYSENINIYNETVISSFWYIIWSSLVIQAIMEQDLYLKIRVICKLTSTLLFLGPPRVLPCPHINRYHNSELFVALISPFAIGHWSFTPCTVHQLMINL